MSNKTLNAKLHKLEFAVKLAKHESREVKPEIFHEIAVLRFQIQAKG